MVISVQSEALVRLNIRQIKIRCNNKEKVMTRKFMSASKEMVTTI